MNFEKKKWWLTSTPSLLSHIDDWLLIITVSLQPVTVLPAQNAVLRALGLTCWMTHAVKSSFTSSQKLRLLGQRQREREWDVAASQDRALWRSPGPDRSFPSLRTESRFSLSKLWKLMKALSGAEMMLFSFQLFMSQKNPREVLTEGPWTDPNPWCWRGWGGGGVFESSGDIFYLSSCYISGTGDNCIPYNKH